MDPSHHFERITRTTFLEILEQYADVVPAKLKDLDEKRYSMRAIQIGQTPGRYFTKDQVVTLVEWKLSHGTFRPKLKQLVESNTGEDIKSITYESLKAISRSEISQGDVRATMHGLTALKGIGPATASLLMSVHNRMHMPFFSDELFRWTLHEDAKGKGWDRPIKYTPKEYLELYEKLQPLLSRIQVDAVDAEKVAYVLGKRANGKASKKTTDAAVHSKKRAADKISAENAQPEPETMSKKSKTTRGVSKHKPLSQTAKPVRTATRSSARLKAQA